MSCQRCGVLEPEDGCDCTPECKGCMELTEEYGELRHENRLLKAELKLMRAQHEEQMRLARAYPMPRSIHESEEETSR